MRTPSYCKVPPGSSHRPRGPECTPRYPPSPERGAVTFAKRHFAAPRLDTSARHQGALAVLVVPYQSPPVSDRSTISDCTLLLYFAPSHSLCFDESASLRLIPVPRSIASSHCCIVSFRTAHGPSASRPVLRQVRHKPQRSNVSENTTARPTAPSVNLVVFSRSPFGCRSKGLLQRASHSFDRRLIVLRRPLMRPENARPTIVTKRLRTANLQTPTAKEPSYTHHPWKQNITELPVSSAKLT